MRKISFLLVLLILCLTSAVFCACAKKIEYVNLTVYHDINQGATPFKIEIQAGDYQVSKELSLLGSTEIANVPQGSATVKITRYGAVETRETAIGGKGSFSLDLRLFGNLETEESGEVYYTVNSAEQLKNISCLSGAAEAFNLKLASDIDLGGKTFAISDFNGTLDGKRGSAYYIISNFNLNTDLNGAGLFLKNHGTLKNIKMTSSNVIGADNVGALVGENYGNIEKCSVAGGTVKGNSYVGGMCGIDYGLITDCTATAEISAQSYYGKVIGASLGYISRGTFSELVGYGIKPAVSGKSPVSEGQTPIQMLLTAMDNWSALNHRTKLFRLGMTLNPLNFMKAISSAYLGNLPERYKRDTYLLDGSIDSNTKLIITAMRMIQGMKKITASGFTDVRLVYDGTEEDGLQKLFAYCDAFVSDTSLDNLLALFGDFSGLYDPFSAAFYLDNEEDYLMGSFGEEAAFLDPAAETLNKRVAADFDTEVYWGKIIADLDRYSADDLTKDTIFSDSDFIKMVKEYIDIVKDYLLHSDLAGWDALLSLSGVTSSRTKNGDLYTVEITVGGETLYKELIDFINERLAKDVDGDFAGLQVSVTFNKPVTVKAEIWDNGNIKSLVVDNVDFTVKAALPEAGQDWLESMAKKYFTYLSGFRLNEIEFTVTNSTPLIQMFSYSESDTDIELQKKVFSNDTEKYVNFVDHTFEWMKRRAEQEEES